MTRSVRDGGSPLRRAFPFLALALAILLVALLTRRNEEGPPLDPRSTAPLGARALVLLLERFGADVVLTSDIPDGAGTVVVLRDQLSRAQSDRLGDWVETGGTLVVTDPLSEFAPPLEFGDGGLFGDLQDEEGELLRRRCGLPALAGVERVDAAGAAPFRVREGGVGCFPVGGGAFVVVRPSGNGVIAAVGGGGAFVNRQIDEADNAALAVSLMSPRPGARVTILGPAVGGGDQTLLDLVSRRVKDALWQLLVAFGLFALWRARRLGRPIVESQPVQIAGSELVVATGELLRQARRRDAAAGMLRSQLRRTLSERLGLPPAAPAQAFAEAAAARADADPDLVAMALEGPLPTDDDQLVELARTVESLRSEVSHAR